MCEKMFKIYYIYVLYIVYTYFVHGTFIYIPKISSQYLYTILTAIWSTFCFYTEQWLHPVSGSLLANDAARWRIPFCIPVRWWYLHTSVHSSIKGQLPGNDYNFYDRINWFCVVEVKTFSLSLVVVKIVISTALKMT